MRRLTLLASLLLTAAGTAFAQIDPGRFASPEPEDRVATWWHWMDGAITREGITKDLEEMKAQGISNATVLNIYRLIGVEGVTPVEFDSPEWYALFRHAVEEADRLGIEIGAANCDGWSESGGPWITPELSMKQYTWRKTFVKGGRTVNLSLAKPFGKERFYRDVAVVAYRDEAPNSFVEASPKLTTNGTYPYETLIKSHKYHDETRHIDLLDEMPAEMLTDGNPDTGMTLDKDKTVLVDFKSDFTAEILQIYVQASAAKFPIPVLIEVSDDGVNFREAGRVFVTRAGAVQKLPFPKTASRHWRLTVNEPLSSTTLSEIALLKAGERGVYDPSAAGIATGVLDLTDKMSADGTLRWTAPKGNWTVIRFGYTSNGKFNHPASPQGVGLECDKMDTTALNVHFAAFPQKLIDAAGEYAGKTFTYFLVDSWECGQQDWTAAMPSEFESRRGYSLVPYIPALCGEVVDSKEVSDAFRHDFDKTRGELVLDNYFKHLGDLCHRAGMKLWSEGIYGGSSMPPVDVLKSYKYSDVPMTEFWAQASEYREWPITYKPGNYGNHAIPYHVSLLYDKPVIGSEAYTGMALYSDSPIDLKLYGDRAYSEGVNRMVLHSYVHQPTDLRPGTTLGIYGQTFNRNNLWFNWSDGFFAEQARDQYLLQRGDRRADALVYIGDALPNTEMSESEIARLLPANIKFQYINREVLLERLSVKDGLIWLDGRVPFKFLCLRDSRMELETALKIEALVQEGAVVYGPKPTSTLSLKDKAARDADLKALADRVWGEVNPAASGHPYGKGRAVTTLRQLKRCYTPDFEVRGVDIDDVLYTHKTLGDTDYWFISNKENSKSVNFEALFDIEGALPELWYPMDGSVRSQMMYSSEGRRTLVPLTLGPRESVFVVFRKGADRLHVRQLTTGDGEFVFPNADGDFSRPYPEIYASADGSLCLRQPSGGSYYAAFSDDTSWRYDIPAAAQLRLDGTVGEMTFDDEPLLGTVPIGGFRDFTGSLDPLVKHYSGLVTYRIPLTLPGSFFSEGSRIRLRIPSFGSTARITLNGQTFETLWDPYSCVDITAVALPGENDLVIEVTNPWRNRLIGDKAGVPSTERHWTTSPLQQKHIPPQQIIHEYALLYPAGISGAITITCDNEIKL